jgi:hypothetical protein
MDLTLHVTYDRRHVEIMATHLVCAVAQGLLTEAEAKAIACEEIMASFTFEFEERGS